jgi:hypothetical protein
MVGGEVIAAATCSELGAEKRLLLSVELKVKNEDHRLYWLSLQRGSAQLNLDDRRRIRLKVVGKVVFYCR